jgi:hypothetical protein
MRSSRLNFRLIGLALLLCAAGSSEQPRAAALLTHSAASTKSVNWRLAAHEDVIAAYEIFRRHHPGMFDPNNPDFPDQLRKARDTALAFADKVDDAEGHMRTLALFSAILADGHARVQATYSGHGDLLWPGFKTVWRDHALHVLNGGEDGPPRGSALLACDGQQAESLIRKEAFAFYGLPDEEGQWWATAPLFFERVQSPYDTLPRKCTFDSPAGRRTAYRLNWRPVPEPVLDHWMAESVRAPIGLTEPRTDIYLITLSSFMPDDQGRAQYSRLFQQLETDRASLSKGRAIVIDLRRNGGGSSSWAEQVADHLWGESAVTAALAHYFRRTQVWWLADAPNIAHFRKFAKQFRAEGRAKDAADLDKVVAGLEIAQKRGDRFYVEDYGASLATDEKPAPPRQLPPVYVIVDGGCASACLDALDIFTRFKGVKLMGAPSSADSTYLDVRYQPLPSDRGTVVLPTKIWVRRPRGSGQVYEPDVPVNDLNWSTATMLHHVEHDLARGGKLALHPN